MTDVAGRLERAATDATLVVLDGFHALKHAIRFGADVREIVVRTGSPVASLRRTLAPDLELITIARSTLDDATFRRLAPAAFATGVVALARRPAIDPESVVRRSERAPVVLLENPRRLENLGACIRVAAAAGAAGLLSMGTADPWHRAAVRGAAGLQFALPVAGVDGLPGGPRPIVAFDPGGEVVPDALPDGAVFAFGTERDGLTDVVLDAATMRVRLPMRPGVSSLNLATAVAVALYAWRGVNG